MKSSIKHLFFFLITFCNLFFLSCKDDFTTDSSYRLSYSTDTLKFDTIFSEELTPTSIIMIYNETDKDLLIEQCDLVTDNNCFQINLDGRSGSHFENISILSGDSVYLFVQFYSNETGVNAPLYIESYIVFSYNNNKEKIVLTAFGQDVHRIRKEVITESTSWENDKPYIIYDTLKIDSNAVLTINEGTTLYFHPGSTVVVDGKLICNGSLEAPITFRGERKDMLFSNKLSDAIQKKYLNESYDYINNQWGGIHFTGNSTNNKLTYTNIRNGNFGLLVDSAAIDPSNPRLLICNSQIHNVKMSILDSYHANIYAYNSIFSCSEARSCVILQGGEYTFNHCTFASYQKGTGAYGKTPYALALAENELYSEQSGWPLTTTFNNCIIYGSGKDELYFDCETPSESFRYTFNHCLIALENEPEGFITDESFSDIIWNENPEFLFTGGKEQIFDFHLKETSAARQKGDLNIITDFPECLTDKDNISRQNDTLPDIGAYQWVEEESEGE